MKASSQPRRPTVRRSPRIESDTPIVPRAVMEAVCEEAALTLGTPLPRRWVIELTTHANTLYAHDPRFRRNIRAKGDKGRDYLWAFARHWLSSMIGNSASPALWDREVRSQANTPRPRSKLTCLAYNSAA